ncbi:MAG: zinc ribbon protein [Bacillus sp. (in: firmicutes)]|nr:zinc ribbon protein [Bacillus sp. (in: firmicutes)]
MEGIQMNYTKKNIGLASVAVVGVLTIGGTAYAYTQHQHTEHLATVKTEIKSEQITLGHLKQQITSFSPNQNGFLQSGLTKTKLKSTKKSLEHLKDSYTDFDIHKNDLKSEIKVVALSKDKVEHDLKQVESKFKAQQTVNALFAQPVIDGNKLTKQAIANGVSLSKVKQVSSAVIGNRTTGDSWFKSLNASIKDAESQLKQIDVAKAKVKGLIKGDKVVKGVSQKKYDLALKEVKKIKNANERLLLKADLNKVLTVVKANEKKADKLAKSEAEKTAKKTGGKVVKQSDGNYVVNEPSGESTSVSASSDGSSQPTTKVVKKASTPRTVASTSSSSRRSTYSAPKTATSSSSSSGVSRPSGNSTSASSTAPSAPKATTPTPSAPASSSSSSAPASSSSSNGSSWTETSHDSGSIDDSVEGGKNSTWESWDFEENK